MRRDSFRSYFVHYRGERNGAIAMVVLTILVILAVEIVPWHKWRKKHEIDSVFFLMSDEGPSTTDRGDLTNPFPFNPNTLSDSGFMQLGFTEREVSTLRNYQKAGGEFRVKKDFAKLYFVDKERYAQLAPYIDLPERMGKAGEGGSYVEKKSGDVSREYFNFDPNTLSDSGFAMLGFSERQIATLRKYQDKGGKFHQKQDFAKLYFVDERTYTALEPYIEIKADTSGRHGNGDEASLEGEVCDINSADAIALKRIRGIGSYYAREIVDLRERLGGYYSLDQLDMIYGMTPGRIDTLSEFLSVDPGAIRKIRIRIATAQEIAAHPYIDLATASRLVEWRETTVDVNAKSLEESGLLNDELYRKFAPYLEYH